MISLERKGAVAVKLRFVLLYVLAVVCLSAAVYAQDGDIGVKWLVEPMWEFDIVVDFRGGMAAVEVFGDEWGETHVLGYVNNLGEKIIPMEYIHGSGHYYYRGAPNFAYGTAGIFSMYHGGVAFFRSCGYQLTPFKFRDAYDFSEGLAATAIGTWESHPGWYWGNINPGIRWGFVDTDANVVIPFEFCRVGPFSGGVAAALRDGYWGFIDRDGNTVIPFKFEAHVDWFLYYVYEPRISEGRACIFVRLKNEETDPYQQKWKIIDMEGNLITPYMFEWVSSFNGGIATFSNFNVDIRRGIIDRYGNITEFGYNIQYGLSGVSNGFIIVSVENNAGGPLAWRHVHMDVDGNMIVPDTVYTRVRHFSNGVAAVMYGNWDTGLWGFIDTTGNEIIPAIYTTVRNFSHGLSAVMYGGTVDRGRYYPDGRWGFIDKTGNIVVPFEFDDLRSFSEGLAWARVGPYWGILQLVTGEEARNLPPLYIPQIAAAPDPEPEYIPEPYYEPYPDPYCANDDPEYTSEPEPQPEPIPVPEPDPDPTPGPEYIPDPEPGPIPPQEYQPSRNATLAAILSASGAITAIAVAVFFIKRRQSKKTS